MHSLEPGSRFNTPSKLNFFPTQHGKDFKVASPEGPLASPKHTACLVLDLRLPGISGLELQAKLLGASYRIPIVFISAHGDQQARKQALAAGAIDFLQKPFSEKALFDAINSALVIQNRGTSMI